MRRVNKRERERGKTAPNVSVLENFVTIDIEHNSLGLWASGALCCTASYTPATLVYNDHPSADESSISVVVAASCCWTSSPKRKKSYTE